MRKNIFGVRIAFAIVLLFFGFIGGYYLAHKSEQEATHALCQSDKNDHAQAQQGGIPSLNTGEYHLILGDNQIDALNTNLANLSFQGCPEARLSFATPSIERLEAYIDPAFNGIRVTIVRQKHGGETSITVRSDGTNTFLETGATDGTANWTLDDKGMIRSNKVVTNMR